VALSGYRARRLFDGLGGPVQNDVAVLIDGDRIHQVVPAAQVPTDTQLEDLGDVTILPGLVDAHVHMIWDGSQLEPEKIRARETLPKAAMRAARHAANTLNCGTTTVRDCGCPGGVTLALRDAIDEGIVRGPRMLCSGAMIVMTGGHCHTLGVEVDGPVEARRAARQQLKEGADFVKLLATGGVYGLRHDKPWSPQLTVEEMRAAADEAGQAGRVTAIHAEGEQGIANAIEAGADTIEHCNQLTPDLAEVMAIRGIYMVPTLTWFYTVAAAEEGPEFPADYVRKGRAMAEASARSITLAKQAGVKIAAGTDSGAPMVPHSSIRRELELLVKLGLTAVEALQAGTRIAAAALRLDNLIGTVEAGMQADLIAVNGDPTQDIRSLYDLRLVVLGGVVAHRSAALEPAADEYGANRY